MKRPTYTFDKSGVVIVYRVGLRLVCFFVRAVEA